jgi:hypothetical protein
MGALGERDESHMGTLRDLSESPRRALPSPMGAVSEPDRSNMRARGEPYASNVGAL